MFKIDKLKKIYKSINSKNFDLKVELSKCRKEYDLNPEYLYLMGLLLKSENRVYLAIDTLILSLKIDYDEIFLLKKNYEKCSDDLIKEKITLLIKLFNEIGNLKLVELSNSFKGIEGITNVLDSLTAIMPGINLKK
tara:strand:- start:2345 stop:2752 length:408 start_codon:yes stop_codon:yes gene_type:complete